MSGGYSTAKSTSIGSMRPQIVGSNSVKKLRKKRKMKFNLKAKIRNWLYEDDSECVPDVIRHDPERINSENGINFQVINASGGRIVQVQVYDRVKDRHSTSLHIITPDEDLATSLAQILALSQLSR